MPNSEKVSQGGPANFARLFYNFVSSDAEHQWIGVMFKNGTGRATQLKKKFTFMRREYHCLYLPKGQLKQITKARSRKNPEEVFERSIDRLVVFIKEKNPDVVFLNGFGVFNWILLIAAQRAGIPSVIQHAGILTKELRVHRDLYTKAGLKMMEEMERDSSRLTAVEIFLNNWSRGYYQEQVFRRKDPKSLIIPLPFNFSAFKETGVAQSVKSSSLKAKLNPKKLHIGVIARWDEIKNHAAVLALAKEIKKQGLPWEIHSVTEIPDNPKYRPQKEEYEKYVSVVAPLDRSGIADFCRSMDLMVQPSLFDVSPTVVLESMALNTPIIISPTVGYVDDFMTHGAQEWIIAWDDMASVIKRIKKLKSKPMPPALRSHLLNAHDQKRVFSSYLRVFSELQRSS